ncbi:hypothetical protein [Saccharothrix syringae]|uniref:Uncharacterized protein n=1 Tax=Saccharothrix syringae TaxID=103733 RepID=A0A5Q0GYQ6_SACSY|nr:hypothetical protein [Saccharothrix syringae]QFZ19099.1 hypothetical protein EKG83_18080 [Saccharothrix syringae]
MTRSGEYRARPALSVLAVGALVAAVLGAPTAEAQPPSAASAGTASTGATAAGRRITAPVSERPRAYTAAELTELNARQAERDAREVSLGRRGPEPRHGALGAEAARPDGTAAQAATLVRDSTIPASGIAGGASYSSYVQEPSTDANGGNLFQVGNWYASRSTDNGSTWSYLDPFTLFGSGFCCDQVTQYDAATGRQFWLLQYSDRLVLANAPAAGAGAFTGWCYWNITSSWFGLAAGTTLDYNDITIANNNVYISTNFFPAAGGQGSAIVRLPKVPMSTCGAFSYNYLNRTDSFTFKLVPGSTDTLFWGSNWGQTNGSSFRVYAWAENSGSYNWWDRTVASYSFYTRNSGQNCGSADNVVKNWCQFSDSRTLGAYRAGGTLGFSFNAKQDASHPFPYTRIVRFTESTKAYLGASDFWGSWGALQFLSMAPNNAGRVGSTFAWGGGTGTTHYYPGAGVNNSPNNGVDLSPNYYLWGGGNTCANAAGLYRWGDYLTVRTYKADQSRWVAAGYRMSAHCGTAGAYSEPHNVLFS